MNAFIFNDTASDGWGRGTVVTVVRPLRCPDEVDAEVGPMFRVRREDGAERDAFADELVPIEPKP